MAFAQPLALYFFLLFIPVILLYLLKQRRRRVQVSTLMFWDLILRDEQSVTSLTRLRKLLSLLLQLLFITLLALALARPMFSKDMLGARRIVVLLDASASMHVQEEDGTRFEAAARLARGVIRGMSLGDTAMLVAVSAEPDVVMPFTNSRKGLLDALETVEASHASTDFGAALNLLHDLPPDERETYVYVISDGAFDPVSFDPPARAKFAYLPVGKATDNVGITAYQVRPLPGSPRDFEIFFEVTNESDEERRVPYEVRIGEVLADAGELTLGPRAREIRTLRQYSNEGGEVEVFVDSEDPFPLDNRAYAVLPAPDPIQVILVTEGDLFLETVLATDEEVVLEVLTPAAYAEHGAGDGHAHEVDVTIFGGAVPETLPEGHAIYIGAWPDALAPAAMGVIEKPLITEWDRDHPVNRHLHLRNVSIDRALNFGDTEGFRVLMQSFGDPLVLLKEEAERKTLVLTFDTNSSDLPLRVAFPILVANAVRYMVDDDAGEAWQTPSVGGLYALADVQRYALDDEPRDTFTMRKPGAAEDFVVDDRSLLPIDRAGFYRLAPDASADAMATEGVALFAANMNHARESDIRPSSELPIAGDVALPIIENGFRLGWEPWLILAALALVLIMVEWVLYHRRLVE